MNSANVALPEKQARNIQTGSLAYWDGTQWQAMPDEDGDNLLATMRVLIESVNSLWRELAAMRRGAIETGMCADFDPNEMKENNAV